VGLIGREIEAAGVPTLSMTSAWDITRAVGPPRAVYLHHPLGNQTGAPGDAVGQKIVRLPFLWQGDPGWEARAYTAEHTPSGPDGRPIRDGSPL
jgi:hypothetical protein